MFECVRCNTRYVYSPFLALFILTPDVRKWRNFKIRTIFNLSLSTHFKGAFASPFEILFAILQLQIFFIPLWKFFFIWTCFEFFHTLTHTHTAGQPLTCERFANKVTLKTTKSSLKSFVQRRHFILRSCFKLNFDTATTNRLSWFQFRLFCFRVVWTLKKQKFRFGDFGSFDFSFQGNPTQTFAIYTRNHSFLYAFLSAYGLAPSSRSTNADYCA